MYIIASDEHLRTQYLPSHVTDAQHAQLGSCTIVSTLIVQLFLNRLIESNYIMSYVQ